MKRILIIMGNHSPESSSVANCIEPLIEELVNNGFEIDIVTDRKQVKIPQYERMDNINVYRVDDCRAMNTITLYELQQIESTKTLKILTQLFIFILKACYYIRYCSFAIEKPVAGWQEKAILTKCVELHKNHNYNVVISVSLPFKSHHIANQFTQVIDKPIKWYIFEFDPFSFNKRIAKSERMHKKLFKDEYNMFQSCDKIFLTPELYKFYSKTKFSAFIEKFISIPYANMQPINFNKEEVNEIKMNCEKINCIFTGRLYKDIRNPSYAFKLFSQLNNNIHFTLITNFTIDIIKQNVTCFEDKFSIYPFQTRDTSLSSLMNADILINIGNTVEFQIPGKIFEYMSTGKPIVHFSKFPDDPALIYLEKYPMVLIINEWEDNIKEQSILLEKFCIDYAGSKLSYEQVCDALEGLDGKSVTSKFVETINRLLQKEKI